MSCYVYMIRSGYGNNKPVKIGMADDPKRRIKELQTGNPEVLNLVLTIHCRSRRHARLVESTLHNQLKGVNVLGEWYKVRNDKLYKVLNKLATEPDCNVIEEFNLSSPVDDTRRMLRSERKKCENQAKHISELERAIRERKIRCGNYRKILFSLGLSDGEISKQLKEIEGKRS